MLLGEFEFHGLTRSNRGKVFPVVDVQCAPLFCILLDPIWVKKKFLKFPTFSGHNSNCALSEFGRVNGKILGCRSLWTVTGLGNQPF